MDVVKCKNGHFYDADAYELCPHCGAECASVESAKTPRGKRSGNRNRADDTQQILNQNSQRDMNPEDKTLPMEMNPDNDSDHTDSNRVNPLQDNSQQPAQGQTIAIKFDPQSADTTEGHNNIQPAGMTVILSQEESDLEAEVKRASANPEGKTVGVFKKMAQRNAEKDASGALEFVEPPVGWLVCVKGVHFGQCFPVVEGRNSIGRYGTNNIVLEKDDSVSRDKHAWVIYEPKKRIFYLKPGEGNALTYLNDNMIEESNELTKLDRIELGNTALLFIPLCGDDFCWESYIKEES